jgi:peroxiredoxin Q/BCP
VGISADRVDRQNEFATDNNLGFPLLSDPDRSVAKQFGVKRMGPLPTKRATFVIDTDRRVLAVVASETNMTTHADEALAVLEARQAS